MVIRMFLSAISPSDVDRVQQLFAEDVVPAFEAHPDCLGVELVMSVDAGVDGLVEGGAVMRWTSEEAMERALGDPSLTAAQVRVRELLRREPVRRVYRILV